MSKKKRHAPRPRKRAAQPVRLVSGSEFGKKKTIEELAAEQGVHPVDQFNALLGKGKTLWKDDAEFEEFLAGIYERRKNGG